MPVHHSAFKQIKKDRKRTLRNKAIKSTLKTYIKKFDTLLTEQKVGEAKEYLHSLVSKINKAETKGVIHRNSARRKISHLYKKLNKVLSQQSSN